MSRRTTLFAIVPEWVLYGASPNGVKVYAILDRHANKEGRAFPERKRLIELTGMSSNTLTKAVCELEDIGAVKREQRFLDSGKQTSNDYWLVRDAEGIKSWGTPQDLGGSPPQTLGGSRRTRVSEREKSLTSFDTSRAGVVDHWLNLPGMMRHRPSYFTEKVNRKLDYAIRQYGADDVKAAMTAYAEILASPAHFWTHRWTLADFLARGLDKFVPEACPYEVFKNKAAKPGALTAADIAARAIESRRQGR